MSELLIEILMEEIPARMQSRAADAMVRLFCDEMTRLGFAAPDGKAYVTPRRLVLHVPDLTTERPAVVVEKRGPRVGAPEAAIQGFLASCGKKSLEECRQGDGDKSVFWFADVTIPAQTTRAVLPEVVQHLLRNFPWPKSMRWGTGETVWVRPIVGILVLLDGEPLPIEPWSTSPYAPPLGHTIGHRFMAMGSFAPKNFDDYKATLREQGVLLDPSERRAVIHAQLEARAAEQGLRVKADEGLLDEVVGLVEWPHVLVGRIDPDAMALPEPVLETVMRHHQRYFSMTTTAGEMAPFFAAVANIVPNDGGTLAVRGFERVLRARLSDASFFWREDLAKPLKEHALGLSNLMFHARLGTLAQKVERLQILARTVAQTPMAPMFGVHTPAGLKEYLLAVELCKADLCTQMVRELPELQGVMGRYYAQLEGVPEAVAFAIEHHYAPQSPAQETPKWPLSMALALIDKIDTLVGFFGIKERPTGSKDPFALRRATLGVIRLVLDNHVIDADIAGLVDAAADAYRTQGIAIDPEDLDGLHTFMADRLHVYLRDRGMRHDVVRAALRQGVNPVWTHQCAVALQTFLTTPEGVSLIQAFRRAANILTADGEAAVVQPELFAEEVEHTLWRQMAAQKALVQEALTHRPLPDYRSAFTALLALKQPLDDFFESVTVQAEDPSLRANRRALLAQIKELFLTIADVGALEG